MSNIKITGPGRETDLLAVIEVREDEIPVLREENLRRKSQSIFADDTTSIKLAEDITHSHNIERSK